MALTRPRLTTIALVLLNGGLLALVVFAWRDGQKRVREPADVVAASISPPDLKALQATRLQNIDIVAIRDQAVFHSRRLFYQPPPPSRVIPTPDYDLAGTMGLPQGRRVAFVKKKSDQSSRTLHVGDDLEGWHVQLIELTRVVMVRDAERCELKSGNGQSGVGLIRGAPIARVVNSATRVLDGRGAARSAASIPSASDQARIYQPPRSN